MTNKSQVSDSPDARAKTRNRPSRAAIVAALNFYAGTRPPPDPEKTKAAGRAPEAALKITDKTKHSAKVPQAKGVHEVRK